jgi:hypothetical protein
MSDGTTHIWTFAKDASLAAEKIAVGAMESDRAWQTQELVDDLPEDGEAVYCVTITARRVSR